MWSVLNLVDGFNGAAGIVVRQDCARLVIPRET
jgi:hypothetical protein